jgi:hypothetical protein
MLGAGSCTCVSTVAAAVVRTAGLSLLVGPACCIACCSCDSTSSSFSSPIGDMGWCADGLLRAARVLQQVASACFGYNTCLICCSMHCPTLHFLLFSVRHCAHVLLHAMHIHVHVHTMLRLSQAVWGSGPAVIVMWPVHFLVITPATCA